LLAIELCDVGVHPSALATVNPYTYWLNDPNGNQDIPTHPDTLSDEYHPIE
jgi:hypothetical protein